MNNHCFLGKPPAPVIHAKPDRIGAIVLAFTLFVAYWGWAGLLYFQGLISLPLGALGGEGHLLVLVDVVIVNLYVFRQRRRARTSRNPRQ